MPVPPPVPTWRALFVALTYIHTYATTHKKSEELRLLAAQDLPKFGVLSHFFKGTDAIHTYIHTFGFSCVVSSFCVCFWAATELFFPSLIKFPYNTEKFLDVWRKVRRKTAAVFSSISVCVSAYVWRKKVLICVSRGSSNVSTHKNDAFCSGLSLAYASAFCEKFPFC